jgi:hypothetical protein
MADLHALTSSQFRTLAAESGLQVAAAGRTASGR